MPKRKSRKRATPRPTATFVRTLTDTIAQQGRTIEALQRAENAAWREVNAVRGEASSLAYDLLNARVALSLQRPQPQPMELGKTGQGRVPARLR